MNQIKAILGAMNLRTGVIVGSMLLLLASGKSFGQGIGPAVVDGAHICTVASEGIDKFNNDKFLSLRNSCRHDVTVNYRYQNRDGCQMEEVVLGARTPTTPFRKANNARVCIEYSEREHQIASGYDFCGDLPTQCADANRFEVVDMKYSPFIELVLSTERLEVPEGQRGVFGISLSHRPIEPVQIAFSHPVNTDISLDRYLVVLDESNWSEPMEIAVGTRQDDDDMNDTITVGIDASGSGYSDRDRSIAIIVVDDENFTPVPPGVTSGTDPQSLDIKATVFAIPPASAPDQATVRIHCQDESASCAVFLDCTAQDGTGLDGWYLSRIPARGTHSLSARDIVEITGGEGWEGKGRLACDIRSEMDIVAQIWTRSGEDILINNSAAILSHWTNEASTGNAYLNRCLDDVREKMDRELSTNHSSAYPRVIDRINRIDNDFRMCRSVLMDGFCTLIDRCERMEAGSAEQLACYGYLEQGNQYCGDMPTVLTEPTEPPSDATPQDKDDYEMLKMAYDDAKKAKDIYDICIANNYYGDTTLIDKLATDFGIQQTTDNEPIEKRVFYDAQKAICTGATASACSQIEECESHAGEYTEYNARYLADIGHIPSPDSSDISNIRIRCSAPHQENCTFTSLECTDSDGMAFDSINLGTISRHHVRHIQAEELADLIRHRWQEMDLSCRVKSDHPITVQVLTRTGGGALVNNSGGL
ncbi:hypothetical protein [Thioalkalivibrio sp. HK1]|uniref:hypothetical protein n=1 Tax=Thioalkalivibrio sp. HK1 TaxID=1469245 RepID=UPI000471A4D7|nr:hypothetical protein [Thioalkalivibrio sp. HK1]